MRKNSFLALACGAVISSTLAPVSVSAKPASYDGTWSVRLVTESGACDSSYSQTVAIENGRVRPVSGASDTAISGGVTRDGNVALAITRSIAQANASGRLKARSGSGAWQLAMLGCSGRWTASRA